MSDSNREVLKVLIQLQELKLSSPVHNNQQHIDENENKENNPVKDISSDAKDKFVSKEKTVYLPTSETASTPTNRVKTIKNSELENSGSSSSSETNDFIKNSANFLDTIVKKESDSNIRFEETSFCNPIKEKDISFSIQGKVPSENCLNSTYDTSHPINLNTTVSKDCGNNNTIFDATYSLNTNIVSDVSISPTNQGKSINDQQLFHLKSNQNDQNKEKINDTTCKQENKIIISLDKTYISTGVDESLGQSLQNEKEEIKLDICENNEKTERQQNGLIELHCVGDENEASEIDHRDRKQNIELNDEYLATLTSENSKTIVIEDSLDENILDTAVILIEDNEDSSVEDLVDGLKLDSECSIKKEESEQVNLTLQHSSSGTELPNINKSNLDDSESYNQIKNYSLEEIAQVKKRLTINVADNDSNQLTNLEFSKTPEKGSSLSTVIDKNISDTSDGENIAIVVQNKSHSQVIDSTQQENISQLELKDSTLQAEFTVTSEQSDDKTRFVVEIEKNFIQTDITNGTSQTELSVNLDKYDGNSTIVIESEKSQSEVTDRTSKVELIVTADEYDGNNTIVVETENSQSKVTECTSQAELIVTADEYDGNNTIVVETENFQSEVTECTAQAELSVNSDESDGNTTIVVDAEKSQLEDTGCMSPTKLIIISNESGENTTIDTEKSLSASKVTCNTSQIELTQVSSSVEAGLKDVKIDTACVPLNITTDIPQRLQVDSKEMAEINEKLQQENSDLKLELNAAKQAKASLELEVSKKDEIILKTQAEALKKEQQFQQDLKSLREQLKEKSNLNENDNIKDLEEALKEAKTKESQATSKLNAKINDELKYRKILEEYEKSIASCTLNSQKLKEENITLNRHLSNMELSFSDLHQKYERTKVMIDGFKSNEEKLKKQASVFAQNFHKQEEKYESLKSHAKAQIDKCNKEICQFKEKADAELIKLKAIIKRLEIKSAALENSLEQKNKECIALSALCEEVTGKRI